MLAGFGLFAIVIWTLSTLRHDRSLLTWVGDSNQWTAVGLALLGVLLLTVSRMPAAIARPVYVVWMSAATAIGIVVSTILLTVLFLFVLPPFALIVRWKDPVRKKLRPQGTYWESYPPYEPTLDRLRRPF